MIRFSFLFRDLLLALVVALLVATACFWAVQTLPGDLALQISAKRFSGVSPSRDLAEVVRQAHGLDRPVWLQYGEWLARLLRLDFGHSLISGRPVLEEIAPFVANSVRLIFLGFVAGAGIAVCLGFLCGRAPNSRMDLVISTVSAILATVPTFLLGVVLVQIFIVDLSLGTLVGQSGWGRLWLPVLTITLALSGPLSRVVRNAVAEVSAQPYMLHAALRGVPQQQLFLRHGVRNAILPVLNYLPVVFLFLVYDVIVIETVFNYRGMGWALLDAVKSRDIPVMQCLVLALVALYLSAAALSDALTRAIYPREVRR